MRKTPTATNPIRRPLILIVDDFSDNREMYSEYLIFAGFDVAEAVSGLEALDKAIAVQPDLIVMDLALPGMDGWEATRRLKAEPRTRRIPVVALTGNVLQAHVRRAKEAGCDGFLAKPCLPAALADEIRRMLQSGKAAPTHEARR